MPIRRVFPAKRLLLRDISGFLPKTCRMETMILLSKNLKFTLLKTNLINNYARKRRRA